MKHSPYVRIGLFLKQNRGFILFVFFHNFKHDFEIKCYSIVKKKICLEIHYNSYEAFVSKLW